MGNLNPLGFSTNRGLIDSGTSLLKLNRAPGPLCGSNPCTTELKRYAAQAVDVLSKTASWADSQVMINALLGQQSFTLGVAKGVGENLLTSAYELVKLINMLALAEYHEARHAPTFLQRLKSSSLLMINPIVGINAIAFAHLSGVDEKAAEAYRERQALFDLVAAVFRSPGEFFGKAADAAVANYNAFIGHMKSSTLSGNYKAGVMFGHVLLDILSIIGGVTGIAKLAASSPRMLAMVGRLQRLVTRTAATAEAEAAAALARAPKAVSSAKSPAQLGAGALSQTKKAEIVAIEKGKRPPPSDYLPKQYLDEHLAQFDDGASRFMSEANLKQYGPAQRDGTSFVMPKAEADALLTRAAGDKTVMTEALGLKKDFFDTDKLVRVDIPKPRELNLRVPSGNEAGANEFWIPGGKLPTGANEAIVDLGGVPAGKWVTTPID
ncbi:hypothetical protein IGB42_01884 [Andreprevotia sp. IGB-42]|uniref:hypothetical protein n=1 Tax=Andreprevotia sp. IGB-42 TaxID=2497473 RepID=UPI001359964E|nr:hypothetical protein [Andreprevotia sp. IGB-42]KAF0813533.1 hypothetical protein IGB42_01884 [Andreprevotia sp. IGB-42]